MKDHPINDLTKKIGETFLMFLLLFMPFGILIVGAIIAINKLMKRWKNKNT